MKKISLVLIMTALVFCSPVHARNDFKKFSLENAFALEQFKNKLGNDVRFYFGKQSHAKVIKRIGKWPTQKKTNAFNKTDEFACQWALLSGLLSLKKRALAEGGNAVINIKTNNDHRELSDSKTFECEVGNIVASVALIGEVVKLK